MLLLNQYAVDALQNYNKYNNLSQGISPGALRCFSTILSYYTTDMRFKCQGKQRTLRHLTSYNTPCCGANEE